MKNLTKISILALMCCVFNGCFLFSRSSSNSSSGAVSEKVLCSRRWELTRSEFKTLTYQEGKLKSTKKNSSTKYERKQWVHFNSNHTCYASGLWGCTGSQELKWELEGNVVTIFGNLQIGDTYRSQVEYYVESINSNYLRIRRYCTPQTSDGSTQVSILTFDNPPPTKSELIVKRWRAKEFYRTVNGRQISNKSNTSSWIQFYSDGTCYENGFLGTSGRRQLRWSISGSKLTISGGNLNYADGNLNASEVVYTIVSISETQLHLSRPDGTYRDGNPITRHLLFVY